MNNFRKVIFINIVTASVLTLASCGGDGIGGTGYPLADINSAPQGTLYRSNEESLSVYFQKSAKLRDVNKSGEPVAVAGDVNSSADDGGAGGAESIVSSTNIQESGVEEADLIKTNGQAIFSVQKPSKSIQTIGGPIEEGDSSIVKGGGGGDFAAEYDAIRIMEPQGDGLKEVGRITQKGWNFSGLYLHEENNRLVALSSENQNYYTNWFESSYFANQKTDVVFLDVENPATASIQTTISFEGTLISSRRNGDILYMALRHYPDYQYVDDEKLLDTTTKDFLPSYKVDNANEKLLSKAEDCFLEKGRFAKSDIITLVAIDLKSNKPNVNSRCFVGSAEAFYASQESLYLATTRWDYQANSSGVTNHYKTEVTTDIHKFAYSGLDFDYRGSGEVSGHLGHNQDSKSFRFSESGEMLRVVTFDEDQWAVILPLSVDGAAGVVNDSKDGDSVVAASESKKDKSPVSLSILKENPAKKTLELVAKLPNADRPEPIGLPGEKLYATRFIGDRAYVVTFRVVDPLYVLDLSNPNDPFIAGELKVDGYSDYLHPISENLLLGVGKDAIPAKSSFDGRGAWYQGVKLSLIDVSSPSNPKEVDKVIIGKRGTDAGVLFDHHAFTGLKVNNKYRVAIPVRLHEEENPSVNGGEVASTHHKFKHFGLYRFEVDIASQKIVTLPPMVLQEITSYDYYSRLVNDRSVLWDDNVHFMHDGKFWSQNWQGTSTLLGPN